MTNKRTCSIEGCHNAHKAKGLCGAHYYRMKEHGDPLAGRTPNGKPLTFLSEVVLAYDGDECLQWPFGVDGHGYGRVWIEGKLEGVHRIVCEKENGPAPSPDHEAAHSCGKGHQGCVSRRHLSWKTRPENKADELAHGTRNRGSRNGIAVLTEDQAKAIKAANASPAEDLADHYGVSKATIYSIRRGENWSWLNV